MEGIMDKPRNEHYLIEYIVTLLNILENNDMDVAHIMEYDGQTGFFSLMESQNIYTAYEVIKFMDEMPGGFLIYHADDKEEIIYANKALLRIFKCNNLKEFRKLTGNSFKGIVYHEDLETVEDTIKKQISCSQYDLDYVEYRIVCKDGTMRWIEDYGHFLHSKSVGDIFYVFLGDATNKKNRQLTEKEEILNDKKQKEQKLQKLQSLVEEYDKEIKLINQEHLRRLEVIEGLSINYESIIYADLDKDIVMPYRLSSRTKYQFRNQFQTYTFTWYSSDYINTWVHPEDRKTVFMATDPSHIREKLLHTKTYYVIINNSEIQYIQLRIVNAANKKQNVSQIVMGYRSVDEEIRREMEQKQILKDALNKADLAINAKDTFLSNMSHDMRTPLNAILGFTELAKKQASGNGKLKKYLNKIEKSGKQLLDLIGKVLEMSWTEGSNLQIEETECNLCDIVQNVYNSYSGQASEKNITFSTHFQNLEHCDVYSDPEKLQQILSQLAGNAITYTKSHGKVDICVIELEKLPNGFITCQFIVKDNGIGISKEFLEHIFEPFEREKNTTLSGIHGTGLGLTITKSYTEMLGGKIEIKSTTGKGSTFTVTLNLRINTHEHIAPSANKKDIFPYIANKKILLVEDNEINLEIETEILEGLGFTIETAKNGYIAVEKMKNSNPGEFDLILMDIQMPVMDGLQATKYIRSLDNPGLANIPVIALSANAFESDKRMSIESGMNAHLTKPIDVPILLETILKALES